MHKNITNEYRYFPESNSVGVNRLFILFSLNQDSKSKIFKAKINHLPKGIIDVLMSLSIKKSWW